MTVQKDVTKNIYVGNGSTRTFPFTFECPAEHPEYIKVYLMQDDGTALATSDYQLDMYARQITYPSSGTALPEGKKLVIMRELPLQQMMNLVNNGPYFAEDVETAFDENVMAMQQIAEKLNRSIIMSVDIDGDAFVNEVPFEAGKSFRIADDGKSIVLTEDPGKVIDEAKGLLTETTIKAEETATNAQEAKQANAEIKTIYNNGSLTPIANLAGSIGTALKRWGYIFANKVFAMNLPIVYKSVAEMKADSLLSAGMTACTLGYYVPNDGGAGTYIIRAKADGDVDDGGSLHELANGNVAELVIENGTVCPEQFGAYHSINHDDSQAIQKTIDYATKQRYEVHFVNNYYFENTIILPNLSSLYPLYIYGEGHFLQYMGTGTAFDMIDHIKLHDFILYTSSGDIALDYRKAQDFEANSIIIKGFKKGIVFANCWKGSFYNIAMYNITDTCIFFETGSTNGMSFFGGIFDKGSTFIKGGTDASATNINFYGVLIENYKDTVVKFTNELSKNKVVFDGCWFENSFIVNKTLISTIEAISPDDTYVFKNCYNESNNFSGRARYVIKNTNGLIDKDNLHIYESLGIIKTNDHAVCINRAKSCQLRGYTFVIDFLKKPFTQERSERYIRDDIEGAYFVFVDNEGNYIRTPSVDLNDKLLKQVVIYFDHNIYYNLRQPFEMLLDIEFEKSVADETVTQVIEYTIRNVVQSTISNTICKNEQAKWIDEKHYQLRLVNDGLNEYTQEYSSELFRMVFKTSNANNTFKPIKLGYTL